MTPFLQHIEIKSPEELSLVSAPMPDPGPGQVLIDVEFAGINRADLLQRLGLYPPPPDASPVPGLEVAGCIRTCGAGVDAYQPGQRVCALTHGGGYATQAIAEASLCLAVPDSLTLRDAAALPEALLTVWANVFARAGLQPGETLWVTGGSSGIGTMAIQMAHHWGARVISMAGTTDKCATLRELGAEIVVNYREEDVVNALTEAGCANNIDVTLDMVGGSTTAAAVELAAVDGRVVCIGVMEAMSSEINLVSLFGKRLTLTGSTLRRMAHVDKAAAFAAIREHMLPHLASGAITPLISGVFALNDAMAAHKAMQEGNHTGKLILECSVDKGTAP